MNISHIAIYLFFMFFFPLYFTYSAALIALYVLCSVDPLQPEGSKIYVNSHVKHPELEDE